MMIAALLLATLAQNAPAPAAAPPEGAPRMILGRDNAAFARALYRAGYSDLVAGACGTIESDANADAGEKAAVRALHLDLRLEEAREIADAGVRKEALRAILDDKEAFIRENPASPEAEEALDNLPDVYRTLGEAITKALEAEKDPEKSATLRREAESMFERAETGLEKRIESLVDWRENPESFRQRLSAAFNLPRTLFFHALVHPDDSYEREKYAKLAIEGIQNFILDYEDQVLAFQALVYEGLAYATIKKDAEALRSFDDAVALRETYEVAADGTFDMPPEAADIVSSAVLQKVILLEKTGRHADVAGACRDFFEKTPDAVAALQGLAILEKQAEAEIAAGDTGAAVATARRLADLDPRGPYGASAREILGRVAGGGSGVAADLDGSQLLKLAEGLAGKGDFDKATDLAHRALASAPDLPDGADLVASAWLFIGAVNAARGRFEDAAVAYDVAWEKAPGIPKAGDALWRSINTYLKLGSGDKRPFFKTRVEERMKLLSTKYADHPYAAYAQLVEGQALEEDQDYSGAAKLYAKVKAGSASYEDARFRIGNCSYRLARKLLAEGKKEEARKAAEEADAALVEAERAIEEATAATLDQERQTRLADLAFAARATRAETRLLDGLGKEAEVAALLDDIESRFGSDAARAEAIWNLRVRALKATGKLDQAVSLLNAIVAKSPDSPAIGAAAGVLARAFDEKAEKLAEKDPKDPAALAAWREASRLYALGTRSSSSGARVIKASDLESIADRLLVIGMHLNGVPDDVDTFVAWQPEKPIEKEAWQRAADVYETALETSGSYKTALSLGRTLGFLGRYSDAAEVLARTIEGERLVNVSTRRLETGVIAQKPQLVFALLDWAVAEHRAAVEEKNKDRFERAYGLFELLVTNSERDGWLWWNAKYFQIRSLVDRGEYENADIALRDVERTTQDFDGGRFGVKPLLVTLKTEIAKKVFRRN